MKRIIPLLAILVLSVTASYAQVFRSKFGFEIDVPRDKWVIVTADQLQTNQDMLNFGHEGFRNVDKKLPEEVINLVRSGRSEIFFRKRQIRSPAGVDNINVFKNMARIPQTPTEFDQVCKGLPIELSKLFGKTIKTYECETRKVGGRDALYAEFDGILEGTKSLQYQIQWTPNFVVAFTATCGDEQVPEMRREFDEIVNTLR